MMSSRVLRTAGRRFASTTATPAPAAQPIKILHSTSNASGAVLGNIEATWTKLPKEEQHEVYRTLEEVQKRDWKELSIDEKKAGECCLTLSVWRKGVEERQRQDQRTRLQAGRSKSGMRVMVSAGLAAHAGRRSVEQCHWRNGITHAGLAQEVDRYEKVWEQVPRARRPRKKRYPGRK